MASDLTFTGERFLPDCAVAASTIGVDIDAAMVAHAKLTYGDGDHVRFIEGSVAKLPLPGASFDLVVSFETIEHLHAAGTRSLPARPEAVARRASGTLVNGRRT